MRLRTLSVLLLAPAASAQSFVHWETPHVHPLERAGALLLAVNTPDARLELFDLGCGVPEPLDSIPVGLDPVSVRARAGQAWVVNHVSDSVSVVDLATRRVVATLATDDEPADVVFAGHPERAFVSCSQASTLLVFDPADLGAAPLRVAIQGEDPRALAVSPDGSRVYVAVFESGNGTTILGGGSTIAGGFPPNAVSDPAGPWGGVNPPPNAGAAFSPPIGALPAPPRTGLVVRRDAAGRWLDDNGGDWTSLVSGPQAALSGRPVGWTLLDHDLAVVDADTLAVSYRGGLLNLCMALAVNPQSGAVCVVGTDATNEVRFEPNLAGRFVRVEAAFVDPAAALAPTVVDLNPHLDYASASVPQALRDLSLGDPRGIAWNAQGTRAWVSGMGSNNLVVIDASGARAGIAATVEVGAGPTGVVVDDAAGLVYVLDRFEGALSVVSVAAESEVARVPFFDPTPAVVKAGRPFLYGTHETSGLGQASCASCHVDARMDRLAWDLGDPAGAMKPVAGQNLAANLPLLAGGFQDFHPMKGPMVTQTLQDIVGKEPHHWRGDRDGLEEFGAAFVGLLGDDAPLVGADMQAFEDFLATIAFPPNPYRNLDNTLPTSLPLPGHFTTGRFGPAGQPLQNGNALRGLALYRPPNRLDMGAVACATCHALPTGLGTNFRFTGVGSPMAPIAPGPNGELHHMLVSQDGSTNVSMKVPQLRNLYDKVGFELTQTQNVAGFGFLHDGSIDSLARFVDEPVFTLTSDQDTADLVAFLLAFSGSDLPSGSPTSLLQPPGTASRDAHAAVGQQAAVADGSRPAQLVRLARLLVLADAGRVGLVARARRGGLARGYVYVPGAMFQSDRADETAGVLELVQGAQPGAEVTFTAVPLGSEVRLGIDRDLDGAFDQDELDLGSSPADPTSLPCGAPLPSAPGAPVVLARAARSITIGWQDRSAGETGFAVERAPDAPGAAFAPIAVLPPDRTSYQDEGLACGSSWLYRVRATSCAGGASSSCVRAATAPCAVSDLRGAQVSRP